MVPDHTSPMVCIGNLSLVPTKLKQTPTSRRSLRDQRQTDPIVVLGHLIHPLMQQPWSWGERFWPSGYTATLIYWVHKHQYTVGTFNTYSQGPTYRSLTDTGRDYNLEGASLPHTTPWPSQPTVSPFHLRAPSGLQFNQILPTKPRFWF
jgi:hypothetical protein